MSQTLRIAHMHPLVRYVDAEQAIIEASFSMLPDLPQPSNTSRTVEVLVDINGADGFHDEGKAHTKLDNGHGTVSFEIVHPQRWWPANMGEQPLYEMKVSILADDEIQDTQTLSFGLTSIRRDNFTEMSLDPTLLVNGEVCDIESIIVVDQINENRLLPATGGSLMLVRDHYGPELLYDAADRAGILLIQSVPISPSGKPEVNIAEHIARLCPHPSLAGWFVGHLGRIGKKVATQIMSIDPTRTIFTKFPLDHVPAA